MAHITNLENNLRLELSFIKNYLFDYDSHKNDYEKWIPFKLSVTLPTRSIIIDEYASATLSVYEIRNFINGIEKILGEVVLQTNSTFEFYSGESFFEFKLEVVPEDMLIEVELWINVGNQTKGNIYGYDEGVRFATSAKLLRAFLIGIKKELFYLEESIS